MVCTAFSGKEYILVHKGVSLWPYTKEEFENFLRSIERSSAHDLIAERGEARVQMKKLAATLDAF